MKLIINSLNYSPELTGIGKYNDEIGGNESRLSLYIAVTSREF
jgi:hypothetical protein